MKKTEETWNIVVTGKFPFAMVLVNENTYKASLF